jgi:hypothetical protein
VPGAADLGCPRISCDRGKADDEQVALSPKSQGPTRPIICEAPILAPSSEAHTANSYRPGLGSATMLGQVCELRETYPYCPTCVGV